MANTIQRKINNLDNLCGQENDSGAKNKAKIGSQTVESIETPKGYIAESSRITQHSSEQYILPLNNSPKIWLKNIIPLDNKTIQHYNYCIILFFANFYKSTELTESTPQKNFIAQTFAKFKQRTVTEKPNVFSDFIARIDQLEIFDPTSNMIKKDIIDVIATDHVIFIAVARSFLLLRDCSHILNSLPNSYKANLLEEFPEEEKTQNNLEYAFKAIIKESYRTLMDHLEQSQKYYRSVSCDNSIQLQVLDNIKKLGLQIKTVYIYKDNITKEKLDTINELKEKMLVVIEKYNDQQSIITEYTKFRSEIIKIIADENCLAEIIENNPSYEISFAHKWGVLESEAITTENSMVDIMTNTGKILEYINENIAIITSKELDNLLEKILSKDYIYEKHINNLNKLCEKLSQHLQCANYIYEDAAGKIPHKLFDYINTKSVMSITEIKNKIKILLNTVKKAYDKINEGINTCKEITSS